MGRAGGSVDEAVLAELRAIRAEIQQLAQRIGLAATREDLGRYLPRDLFDEHMRDHERGVEGWRFWGPFVVSGVALLLVMLQAAGLHLTR